MSSKKCLTLYKNEVIDMVNKHNVQLRYDATVGGSIPICKVFQSLSGFDSISKIYGIANATTNYILTLMHNDSLGYNEALEKAQKKGYAENDVWDDLGGWDALYKMCILLRFGVGIDDKSEDKVKQIFYVGRLAIE